MGKFDFLYRDELSHRAISVYMYLSDRTDKQGQCFPSISTIAYELKLSQSTVKRALGDLTRAGYATVEHRFRENGGKSSSLYILHRPTG